MLQYASLRKRNKVVLTIVSACAALYCVLSFINFFDNFNQFPFIPIFLCILTTLLFKFHFNEYLICALIIFTINLGLIHIITLSMNIYFSIFLIFALFIIAIYQSAYLNSMMMIVFGVEILLFFYMWYPELLSAIGKSNVIALVIILSFLLAISLIQGFYFNISYRKIENRSDKVEKDFLSKEGYLKLFFENAKDSIAVFDLDNRVIAVNPAFEKLYGWTGADCYGKYLPMVPPEKYEQSKHRIKLMQQGESFDLLETVDMKKDGTTFDAEVTLSPLFDSSGKIIATSVITRDITYRKEAEKILLINEKLNLAGEIAAGVAHEIRNPLTVISGFTQMMGADEKSPFAYYYQLIDDEIERINLIINEFLLLSKPDTNEGKPIDFHQFLDKIMQLFTPQLRTVNISYKANWGATNYIIEGNSNRLIQVFINIMKNSMEAITENGHINITTKNSEQSIVVTIEDNGIGMSQKVINNIFEPFFTTKEQGTGLGMMISNKIIEEHGGNISIHSEMNLGTQIIIELPLSKNEFQN